jgi:hypothetical protein
MTLQERIAYLILRKSDQVCTKATAKEIMKLMAITNGERLECGPEKHLVNRSPANEEVRTCEEAVRNKEFERRNQDFTCWKNTRSCAVKDKEGNCRDTCELNWPIAYAQIPDQKFDEVRRRLQKLTPDRSSDDTPANKGRQWFYTYKNVIISIPICANSFLDHGINEVLNDVCQGQC